MWFVLLALPTALAADVLVFGDSWAEGSPEELQDALNPYGLDVVGYGIGGTTAHQYANDYPTAIPTVLATHPEARWAWVSMGGNDLFANYNAGAGATNAALYDANFRTVLDQIHTERPDLRVVSFGYDFVNFEQSADCIATAWTYFGTGTLTPTINGYFLADIHETLAALDPDVFRYTYVDHVWGTLQAAGGVAGAPNVNVPSPAQYMSDCIHPNGTGYRLIQDVMVEAYWGRPQPVAAMDGPTTLCEGEPGTWADASTDAVDRQWWVDGVMVGTDPTVAWDSTTATQATIELVVGAGAWEDRTSRIVDVVDCSDTGEPGGDDSGDPGDTHRPTDTGMPDDGSPDGDGDGKGAGDDDPSACGCASTGAPMGIPIGPLGGLAIGLLGLARRRSGPGPTDSPVATRGTTRAV
jgi:MYXO-CTERM domain-containing protein